MADDKKKNPPKGPRKNAGHSRAAALAVRAAVLGLHHTSLAAPTAAHLGSPGPVSGGDPKDDAIANMRLSIAGLNEAFNLLDAAANKFPPPPLEERQQLLADRGDLFEERVAQELLLIELEAANTIVREPSADSGQALSDALEQLERMRAATDQVSRLLDLAAAALNSYAAHRAEVGSRTGEA